MFGKLIRSAMLTLALAGGATAAVGGIAGMSASAQEIRIGIGIGSGPVVQVRDQGYDHRRDRWRDRDRGGCDARQALQKADRMGVHRARVVDAGRRTVTVEGRDRGGRTFVRFANARGCPVVGQR